MAGLLFEGTWGTSYGVGQVLFKATPLLFTGIAVDVALRAGLFNIGAEGQLAVGSLAAGVLGAHLPPGTPALVRAAARARRRDGRGRALGARARAPQGPLRRARGHLDHHDEPHRRQRGRPCARRRRARARPGRCAPPTSLPARACRASTRGSRRSRAAPRASRSCFGVAGHVPRDGVVPAHALRARDRPHRPERPRDGGREGPRARAPRAGARRLRRVRRRGEPRHGARLQGLLRGGARRGRRLRRARGRDPRTRQRASGSSSPRSSSARCSRAGSRSTRSSRRSSWTSSPASSCAPSRSRTRPSASRRDRARRARPPRRRRVVSALDVILSGTMLAQTARMTIPYGCAALGGVLSERSGVVNIALEGTLLASRARGRRGLARDGSALVGIAAGVACGAPVGLVHALLVVRGRVDAIVERHRAQPRRARRDALPAARALRLELELAEHPGASASARAGACSRARCSIRSCSRRSRSSARRAWMLRRTRFGLRLRACGEDPSAAQAVGVHVVGMRTAASRSAARSPASAARRSPTICTSSRRE